MSFMSAQHAIHVIHDSKSVLSVMPAHPHPRAEPLQSFCSAIQHSGPEGDMYYSRWKRHKHQKGRGWETNTLLKYVLYTGGKD
jgi:hypothetical protein